MPIQKCAESRRESKKLGSIVGETCVATAECAGGSARFGSGTGAGTALECSGVR